MCTLQISYDCALNGLNEMFLSHSHCFWTMRPVKSQQLVKLSTWCPSTPSVSWSSPLTWTCCGQLPFKWSSRCISFGMFWAPRSLLVSQSWFLWFQSMLWLPRKVELIRFVKFLSLYELKVCFYVVFMKRVSINWALTQSNLFMSLL